MRILGFGQSRAHNKMTEHEKPNRFSTHRYIIDIYGILSIVLIIIIWHLTFYCLNTTHFYSMLLLPLPLLLLLTDPWHTNHLQMRNDAQKTFTNRMIRWKFAALPFSVSRHIVRCSIHHFFPSFEKREKKKRFDPQTLIQSMETTFSTLICISSCEFWICFGFGFGFSLLNLTNSSHLAYLVLKNRILNVYGILCTLFKINCLFFMHNIVCDYELRFDDFLVAIWCVCFRITSICVCVGLKSWHLPNWVCFQ